MNAKFTFRTTEYMSEVLGKYQTEIHKGKQGVMINDLLWRGIEANLESTAMLYAITEISSRYNQKFISIDDAQLFFDEEKFKAIRNEYGRLYYAEWTRLSELIGFNWGAGWIGNHTGRTPDEGDPLSADEAEKNRVAGEDLSE